MAEVNLKAKLPSAPRVISITATEDGKAELKWKNVPLAEKYDIKRSLTPGGEYQHIDWATGTSFVDSTVQRNVTYWYKVVAWKRMEGKKTHQRASAVTAFVLSDVSAPSGLSALEKQGEIHLSWNKGEADRFRVYRSCDLFSAKFFIGETTAGEFVDKKVVSGQAYHYCVQALKKSDGKELHGNFTKEVDGIFIDKTEVISAKKSFGGRVTVEARVIAGSDGYIFERSEKKDGEFTEVGRTDDITAISFEEKLPSRMKTYYYRVCAFKNVNGREFKGAFSDIRAIR